MIWVGLLLIIGVIIKENNHFKTARGFYTAALFLTILNLIVFSIRCFANLGATSKETAGASLLTWIIAFPVEVVFAFQISKARDRIDTLIAEGATYKTRKTNKATGRGNHARKQKK